MSAPVVSPATRIKCGNCKNYHVTVDAVKSCFRGDAGVFTIVTNEPNVGERAATRTRELRQPGGDGPLASTKQLEFLRKLCDERATTLEYEAPVPVDALRMGPASELIKELLSRPKAAATPTVTDNLGAGRHAIVKLPEVPAGHYALRVAEEGGEVVKFFRVDRPTEGRYKGRTFLKVQASSEFYPVRDRAAAYRVLELIAADPATASKLYGTELGKCGVCNRTLTDETSRAAGIGPICAGKAGW